MSWLDDAIDFGSKAVNVARKLERKAKRAVETGGRIASKIRSNKMVRNFVRNNSDALGPVGSAFARRLFG